MKNLKFLKKIGLILFGNFCVAVGVVFFVVQAGFISGGVTGIALLAKQYLHLPLSYGIAILSLALLVLGWLVLGKEFAIGSALSAVSYPAFVWGCEMVVRYVPYRMTTDVLSLNLGCSILLMAFGIAMVMRQGASTGGLDIIAMILHKKRGVSLATAVSVMEVISMSTQVIYSTLEGILGGVLLTILFPMIMNRLISKGEAQVEIMVYSPKYEEINRYIGTVLDRGSTLFRVQGGYTGQDTYALQTIVTNRELFQLKEAVLKIDPDAFMTTATMSRVNGRGFTLDKEMRRHRRNYEPSAQTEMTEASGLGAPEP